VSVPLPSFTPKDWQNDPAGGTPIMESDLDLRDNTLAQLIAYVDQLSDTVAAIGASVGNTGQQIVTETLVTPTTRGNPVAGRRVYDTTLLKPIWGDGSNWRDATGTLLTGNNAAAAPQNMVAVVNPDNSINLSWDAVAGAAASAGRGPYILYESQSLSGVSGATALATNSTVRNPGTMRNYEYWVTAMVGGVETAASNHVFPTLPYGSTTGTPGSGSSGGGFTGSPAQFLNIGGVGGYWNLGIGYPTGHVDITYSELRNGFVDSPYFVMNAAGTAVVFWTPMNGGKTSSNTKYARTELRELKSDGVTKAAWDGTTGLDRMQGKSKVMHYAPIKCEMCVAQVHNATDDMLQIRPEAATATGSQTWRLSVAGTKVKDLITGVALGQEVSWDIEFNNNTLTVRINGTSQWTQSASAFTAGQYFKVGSYPQQNSTDQANSPTDYASVELRDLVTTHT
jgi:hypothetical protein